MWEKVMMMSVGALVGVLGGWFWFMKTLDNELTKWEKEERMRNGRDH